MNLKLIYTVVLLLVFNISNYEELYSQSKSETIEWINRWGESYLYDQSYLSYYIDDNNRYTLDLSLSNSGVLIITKRFSRYGPLGWHAYRTREYYVSLSNLDPESVTFLTKDDEPELNKLKTIRRDHYPMLFIQCSGHDTCISYKESQGANHDREQYIKNSTMSISIKDNYNDNTMNTLVNSFKHAIKIFGGVSRDPVSRDLFNN